MKILLNLILVLISFNKAKSHSISEYEESVNYLRTFGYLKSDEKSQSLLSDDKISHEKFTKALKEFQKHGNIAITGKIDKSTLTLMKTPRCGIADNFPRAHKNRQKRYVLLNTKWHKRHITWSFNHKNGRYYYDSSKIRRTIAEALHVWQKHSTLIFEEISSVNEADIRISFEARDHSEVDNYAFRDETLAHAFTPGSGIGGDVHFRDDVNWDFNVLFDEKPSEGKVSFFAVALHELGHSLGLGHTDDPSAVMYHFYSTNTATLSVDDIRGIQHIYGAPSKPQIQSSGESTKPEVNFTVPDKCNMSYDAIATIRGELFIFHGKFMWRPDTDGDRTYEIRQMWSELPENFERVDAVFETSRGKILFFIGDEIFIFDAMDLIDKSRLYHIGMGWNVKHVDAVFRWSINNRIYIFSGENYWRFDEEINSVEKNYPKLISSAFRDVYDIDTAFTYKNELYFFKNEFYYEFDDSAMRMKRMRPGWSAEKFMKCSLPNSILFSTRFDDDIQDFIVVDEEVGEDFEHFEKSDLIELNKGDEIRFEIFMIFLIFLRSFVF